jgi:hypothetical protein
MTHQQVSVSELKPADPARTSALELKPAVRRGEEAAGECRIRPERGPPGLTRVAAATYREGGRCQRERERERERERGRGKRLPDLGKREEEEPTHP